MGNGLKSPIDTKKLILLPLKIDRFSVRVWQGFHNKRKSLTLIYYNRTTLILIPNSDPGDDEDGDNDDDDDDDDNDDSEVW